MIARKLGELLGIGRTASRGYGGDGWHPLAGGRTDSGEIVTEESAMTLSAVFCATRVLTETLAMLPLNLREHLDNRRTETAYRHPVQGVIHDSPNPEMDRFGFFDTLVPQQINAKGAFAEIVRDRETGAVAELWPIDCSRLRWVIGPVRTADGSWVGSEKKRVYLVKNNDHTETAIPASDMLYVPGVLGRNGETIGLPKAAAQALGVIQATEKHVGSFYKNGATPDFAVIIKNNMTQEEKQNLRTSWREKHTGAGNAHKALMLFGDADVKPIGISPEDMLLLQARQFGVQEVSRFWRVPPHMLSDLGRATWANIEDQGQDFITYSLGPWIARWELALKRQLLTPDEQKRFSFKFTLNAILRGNSAARMAYYTSRFNIGSMTINEIRELEDENPLDVPEADKPMIQGNNYVPLDRIGDVATLNASQPAVPDEPDDDTEDDAEDARKIALDVSRGCLTVTLKGLMEYEARAAMQKSETKQFADWIVTFYDGKFRETFKSQVGPIVERASKLGIQMTCDDLADLHCNTSRFQIDSCLNKTRAEFLPSLKTLFETWTHRAEDEASAAFGIAGDA